MTTISCETVFLLVLRTVVLVLATLTAVISYTDQIAYLCRWVLLCAVKILESERERVDVCRDTYRL